MGRNRKKRPVYEQVPITDAAAEGKSIARVNDMVVFVQNAVPGDVADLQVVRKRKKYKEARAIRFHKYSDKRVEPECRHFGVCGGCKWQNLDYQYQLQYKQQQVEDQLRRLGKVELPEISPIFPSENIYFYRNKLEFTFSNMKWLTDEQIQSGENFDNRDALGFHIPGRFDKILDIEKCHLQPDPSNAIRNEVRRYAKANDYEFFDLREQTGFLRNLIVRNSNTGGLMVVPVFAKEDKPKREKLLDHLKEQFPEITSLMYIINTKKNDSISDQEVLPYAGKDHITEEMEGLQFRVGPKSFFQTNSQQAYNLYKIAREFAGIQKSDVVYDLYTGTGTIACFIAGRAQKVVGIEYIEAAIEDARENARLNGIGNCTFISGDMKDVLTADFAEQHEKPDVIITDPPRAGMHQDVVNRMLELEPRIIVYVSCNPATQARDIGLMDEKYKVEKVQPVDMFPHTYHVENVVKLGRR